MVGWAATRFEERSLTTETKLEPRALADRIAAIAADKLATDIVMLDMRGVVGYTDWLVIATARSDRHAKAVAEDVIQTLKRDDRILAQRVEGQREGTWILVDYLDVVLHVFTPETRGFYRLDRLWGQVPTVEFAS